MTTLFIFTGSDNDQSFELNEKDIYIGRSPDNDIQVSDISVSRRHLKITQKDNRVFIKDLKSRNGTYINGNQIKPGVDYELNESIPIVIGMSVICIGKGCLESIAPLVDSLGYHLNLNDRVKDNLHPRTMTVRKNKELIKKVNSILDTSSNINEISEKILDHILNHFLRVDRVVILLSLEQSSGEVTETVISRSRESDENIKDGYSRMIVDRVIMNRKPISISNVSNEDEIELSDTLKILKIGSVMCAPLISGSKILGVIYIDSYKKPHGFREEDLSLLSELSDLTAMALDTFLLQSNAN